ncbi:Na+/H+ antiporter NhaA [Limnobaculum zhutongyuii]|uniref:Na(+)/H(+) antiporter NhaA n=1 Tax=Limnobaculum zhutongyuii TaxID=2498113 RepID=A0A411WMY0_9GAMM|nr:Na+/H+ antiporter NhaA [Limnobaculum zhutongyuii]QBH97455.1 Na+/H+ antiporter NhaA [Limnobaculum zhutongyuii]TQS90930.1 Na+/H+ antiporter NhaA [Limnobaculum zhutongyuii]
MTHYLRQFLKLEASGGILLIIAALIAMIMANSPLLNAYEGFLHLPIVIKIAALDLSNSLAHWINDGLMAIFFLVIGLEVKKELIEGSLAGRDKAMFPVVAAIGGMILPALVYLIFNMDDVVTRTGWAIPAATDIAFALGVMALLGSRVPTSLKAFLMALAIIDDLGAIIIIALFYTKDLSMVALVGAAVTIAIMAVMNWRGVGNKLAYIIVGAILWVFMLKSGVHATLAGVITGFFIPLNGSEGSKPLDSLIHQLHPWVTYFILPLFAFANAGVALAGVTLSSLSGILPLGIMLGLVVGKPLGIFGFCWVALKTGLVKMPESIQLKHIFSVSVLCGIGFTMSIFISSLAFEGLSAEYITYSRLGILIGSTVAAVLGYFLLKISLTKLPPHEIVK